VFSVQEELMTFANSGFDLPPTCLPCPAQAGRPAGGLCPASQWHPFGTVQPNRFPFASQAVIAPNGRCVYTRVLVAAECQDQLLSCWTCHGLNHILRGSSHLSNGYWDGKKFG